MNILEDDPVFFRVINTGLILEGFGVGFEVDHIAAVFLLRQDFANGAVFPTAGVWLRLFAAPADAFFVPIRCAVENRRVSDFEKKAKALGAFETLITKCAAAGAWLVISCSDNSIVDIERLWTASWF